MTKPENVRVATWEDEDRIYDLLVALHRANKFGWGFPFRPEIVQAQIEIGTRPDYKSRSDPTDRRLGKIGVIDGENGKLAASVGVFFVPPMWFTDALAPQELWLFTRPEDRHRNLDQDLFAFADWIKEQMRDQLGPDYPLPWPLYTGFMHDGRDPKRFSLMERLWRMRSRGRKVGVLYRVD